MMEEIAVRPGAEYIPPPLPPKVRPKKSSGSTLTQIDGAPSLALNGYGGADDVRSAATIEDAIGRADRSSMHSIVLNSSSPTATVFVAAGRAAERDTSIAGADAAERAHHDNKRSHAVTIRVNTDAPKVKAPIISSVQLKSGASVTGYQTFADVPKKNNSIVRINVEETPHDANWDEDSQRRTSAQSEKNAPYICCNSYSLNSATNMVMSSGQCSPSDTLDSGTCSDLDGTPPPLPKKKSSKANGTSKCGASVTLITFENTTENSQSESNHSVELDFEDNDSNISCDSLNSSELNGSINTEESNENKKDKSEPPAAPEMPSFVTSGVNNNDGGFLPQGLLQDIRERSAKLNTIPTENTEDKNGAWYAADDINDNGGGGLIQESAHLTSFQLVSQVSNENKKNMSQELTSLPVNLEKSLSVSKVPLISESTYEDRQKQKEKKCHSGSFIYDTDKYYDFHLNEKVFDEPKISVVRKCDSADDASVYFAGVKDYKTEDVPATIRSSKGTIRGVKNRVRAGIATFLQIQTNTKSYKEKDAGKVVLYTTTMGIVRGTYQSCVLVKKILRNLLVKYEERDVFMSTEYQDEIRDRMHSEDILIPQLFIDGHHIGDADTVEKLNESGELRKMLKPYKSADACNTCQMCGGFRLLPCRICSGSKKSLHRNHFTAEFVALKCMNCDEVGLVKCEACS